MDDDLTWDAGVKLYDLITNYRGRNRNTYEQIKSLIETGLIDVNRPMLTHNNNGFTLLQYALNHNLLDIFALLLENGANPNTLIMEEIYQGNNNYSDETLLMYCIVEDKIEYIELLLRYGADVNYTNNIGTALHYAVDCNNIEIVELILKYFPDTRIRDEDGETALELAKHYDDDDIIELIADYNRRIAATRIQSHARRRRTFKKLQKDLIKEQSRMLGEPRKHGKRLQRLPDSKFMEPYISPMLDRRELIRTLARDRRQRTVKENFRTARFLKELEEQYGGRRRKNTRKKYRYSYQY